MSAMQSVSFSYLREFNNHVSLQSILTCVLIIALCINTCTAFAFPAAVPSDIRIIDSSTGDVVFVDESGADSDLAAALICANDSFSLSASASFSNNALPLIAQSSEILPGIYILPYTITYPTMEENCKKVYTIDNCIIRNNRKWIQGRGS